MSIIAVANRRSRAHQCGVRGTRRSHDNNNTVVPAQVKLLDAGRAAFVELVRLSPSPWDAGTQTLLSCDLPKRSESTQRLKTPIAGLHQSAVFIASQTVFVGWQNFAAGCFLRPSTAFQMYNRPPLTWDSRPSALLLGDRGEWLKCLTCQLKLSPPNDTTLCCSGAIINLITTD